MIDILHNDALVEHARRTPGEIWEFACNYTGPEYGDVPRVRYTDEMRAEVLAQIGDRWVSEYSLFDKPYPPHQSRKIFKDLAKQGKVERRRIKGGRKAWLVKRL